MKKIILVFAVLISIFVLTTNSYANVWINNVTVTQLSSYAVSGTHFVWTSGGFGGECTATPLNFDENAGAGKSLFALLLSAFLSGKQVNIQASGCNIVEVYIH